MNLILARHGETDYNKDNRICGVTDIPLNNIGIQQAHELAKILHKEPIEKIYSGPLIRTVETSKIINSYLDVGYIISDKLREMDFGSREGLPLDEAKRKYNYLKLERDKDIINFRYPDSESYGDCINRAKNFLEEIVKSPYETVLVVTHAVMIQCFQYLILGEDILKLKKKHIPNASPLRLKLK